MAQKQVSTRDSVSGQVAAQVDIPPVECTGTFGAFEAAFITVWGLRLGRARYDI